MMKCAECEELMDRYLDGALDAATAARVREHAAECERCRDELAARDRAATRLRAALPRLAAPDVLRARIHGAIEREMVTERRRSRLAGLSRYAAVALFAALAGGAITFAVMRPASDEARIESAVLQSHVRSLMPGHLTDVESTNLHNVKPWFNGRVDMSPAVPNLDSAGFPLLGGRLDYVDGHVAAAVVYGRRKHVVTVYSWPERADDLAPTPLAAQGFHLVRWRRGGVESWAVSDIPMAELLDFARRVEAAER